MKTMINKKIIIALILPFILSSCAFIKLQKDLDKLAASGTIHGKIIASKKNKQATIIIVALNQKKDIIRYKILYKDVDYYAFVLPTGKIYNIALFEDQNNNMRFDSGEPSAFWKNKNGKLVHGNRLIADMEISEDNKIPSSYTIDIKKTDKKAGDNFTVKTGEIADINDKKFSPEAGVKGLWTPLRFLENNGIGIYFMEKYDPEKIPILFIYGIGGYPQSWTTFFKEIDRTRYQPWFYYYPSGFRIGKAGNALNIIMNELHLKYKFKSIFILAHSMGGLVAYDFIRKNTTLKKDNYIKLLITISTPWEGDKDAEWAKHAPAVIPCWKDLMPDSPFINQISPDKIPKDIPYYLLFSFHGDRKPFRLNNDNIVYLASELKLDMQKRAEKMYGFDLTHTEILKHDNVINTCNTIFAEHTK